MRALVQRVARCTVSIDGTLHSETGAGMLVLLGVTTSDGEAEAQALAEKCAKLRIFDDDQGKMNINVQDAGGDAMVVSQFTLYGDTRRGNRPSYTEAAPPEQAEHVYDAFVRTLRGLLGSERVKTGVFKAMMQIELVNDGPVTLLLESKQQPS
jgi:D-tyrosyl-tRNA(Tyr) deacylase